MWKGNWRKNSGQDDQNSFHSTFWDFASKGQIDMMQFFAEKPPSIDNFGQIKWTGQHTIAYAIDILLIDQQHKESTETIIDSIKQLFVRQIDNLFKYSKMGNLPIHLACQTNNSSILTIMIDAVEQKSPQQLSIMLNQKKKDKYWQYTPLMVATKYNSTDCIKILCKQESVVKSLMETKARYPNLNANELLHYHSDIGGMKLLKKVIESAVDDVNINYNMKISTKATGTTDTLEIQSDNSAKLLCCDGHSLYPATTAVIQCDHCGTAADTMLHCHICNATKDATVYPSNLCYKCSIATTIWTTIAVANGEISQQHKSCLDSKIASKVKKFR